LDNGRYPTTDQGLATGRGESEDFLSQRARCWTRVFPRVKFNSAVLAIAFFGMGGTACQADLPREMVARADRANDTSPSSHVPVRSRSSDDELQSEERPEEIVRVAAGGYASCAVTDAGAAYCWGSLLGYDMYEKAQPDPETFGESIRWSEIGLSAYRGCGLDMSGRTFCWGTNAAGQLGSEPDTLEHAQPLEIAELPPLRSLAVGPNHSCGIDESQRLYCWGYNANGELGRGRRSEWEMPDTVAGGLRFSHVSAYGNATCAVTIDHRVYCWGLNLRGELGHESEVDCSDAHEVMDSPEPAFLCSLSPSRVETDLLFQSVELATSYACGITTAGVAYCWGGEEVVRHEIIYPVSTPPWAVNAPSLESLTSGWMHWCGTNEEGTIHCWGENLYYQRGAEESQFRSANTASTDIAYRAVSAGEYHTCGLSIEGAVYCWGRNYGGQLGAESPRKSARPIQVHLPL